MTYLKYSEESGDIVCKIKKDNIVPENGFEYLYIEVDLDIDTVYIEKNEIKQKSEFHFIIEKINDKLHLIKNIPSNTSVIYNGNTYNIEEDSIEFEMDHPGDYTLYFRNVKYINREVFLQCP